MSRHLARNNYHLMRGAARRTTVDELRRSGRRTVSVLNFRDVQDLIEQAVENTLKRRGLKLDGPGIHEDVRLEFLALMRERDLLSKTVEDLLQEKEQLRDNRQKLGQAIAVATDEYRSVQEAAIDDEESEELARLEARVEALLRELLAEDQPEKGDRAVAIVAQAFAEQRALTAERARRAHEARLSQMDRRIGRLKHKLQETEDMLARAQADGGLEAIPGQPIQPGLDVADPSFETKKALLSEIFKLNVELGEMLGKN